MPDKIEKILHIVFLIIFIVTSIYGIWAFEFRPFFTAGFLWIAFCVFNLIMI